MSVGRILQTTQALDRPPLEVPKPIAITQLQTTPLTLYAADDRDFIIRVLWAANVTAGASTLSLYIVPNGGTASIANQAYADTVISANTTIMLEPLVGHLVEPGASIQARCSVNNAINIGGWGMDYEGAAR